MSHNPSEGLRVPVSTFVFDLLNISNLCLSKIALHPASHSCSMERSDANENLGKMRARTASFGRCGMGK